MIWLLLACESREVAEARCQKPITELVEWRNERTRQRLAGNEHLSPAELLAGERAHVDAAVAALAALPGRCENQWRFSLWSEPDTPPARLRDEAIRRRLGLPAIDYTVNAVGSAGLTTDGRVGIVPAE